MRFKIGVIIMLCFLPIMLNSGAPVARIEENTEQVTHLFTHALIAYPDIAFDLNNEMAKHYDRDCLTALEFKAILQELYINNFILVSPQDIYNVVESKVVRKYNNYNGKKPLLLSFDDINYYSKKMNRGMNDKIMLDNNGRLCTYTENAVERINYDNEVITILENFVSIHPDFSFNNAKGTICLTGFDGILGYRVQSKSPSKTQELKLVLPIVERLKELNWKFACHSFGHYHMKNISYKKFVEDTDSWIQGVGRIIGDTDIYCYPYGEYEIELYNKLSMKHQYLLDKGFRMFWGVGGKTYWSELPNNESIKTKSSIMDRIPLDGYTLRKLDMSPYFRVSKVIDARRPKW